MRQCAVSSTDFSAGPKNKTNPIVVFVSAEIIRPAGCTAFLRRIWLPDLIGALPAMSIFYGLAMPITNTKEASINAVSTTRISRVMPSRKGFRESRPAMEVPNHGPAVIAEDEVSTAAFL